MADQQHKHRDLWVGLAVGLLAIGASLSLAIWSTEHQAPRIGVWPYVGEVGGAALLGLGVFLAVAVVRSWWLPGGFKGDAVRRDEPALKPLQVHYESAPPYCRASRELGEYRTEYHIGIANPDRNPQVSGVRLEWMAISPPARLFNELFSPEIPCAVPRDTGGDPAIGIDLPPGRQELWAAVSTWIGPDGLMAAREFAPRHTTTHGDPSGFPYRLQPGDRLRFIYRIVADNLPHSNFSFVLTATDDHIQCHLEG